MANKYIEETTQILQVENYLKVVAGILKLAKQCYQYSVYLDVPHSADEFAFIINSQSFIIFKVISARTAVIELSKLYGKNGNKYNFISFTNSLTNGQFGKKFKQNSGLNDWLSKFKDNEDKINKIIALRDKVFAHTDLEHEIASLQKVVYEDIRYLIEISETYIDFIYKEFFNSQFNIAIDQNELKNNLRMILITQSNE